MTPGRADGRITVPQALATLALLTAHGALAAWLFAHPPSLASDDAFNFARGLTRFSILDFSPHFPGYPGFVGLGRLVELFVPEPVVALQTTTILAALLIPFASAYAAWRMTGTGRALGAAYLLALICPLLPDLALCGLSDGAGLLFFLLFLALMAQRPGLGARPLAAGLALALAATCRPSYGPMYAAAAVTLLILAPGRMIRAGLVAGTGCLVALTILLAREGLLYFTVGARFIAGHTEVWGNTLVSGHARTGWGVALGAVPLLAAGLVVSLLTVAWNGVQSPREPARQAALAALVVMIAWTVAMQNAEHLRHLAPILLVSGLLLATSPWRGPPWRAACVVGLVALLQIGALARGTDLAPRRPSPLASAEAFIARTAPDAVVVTNEGVAYLRDRLSSQRVVDAFDTEAALAGLDAAQGETLRLSSRPITGAAPLARFPSRVPAEAGLALWRLNKRP